MTNSTPYTVGQRIVHPTFGVGLIVEVRHGRGSDVLEVVFGTELKRLSARLNWVLAGEGSGAAIAPTATAVGESDPAGDDETAVEDGENGHTGDLAALEVDGAPAGDGRTGGIWIANEGTTALLDRWQAGDHGDSRLFTAGYRAERLSAWAAADRLLSLDSLRGVERFPHQLRAALKVLRDLGGRALLADEVGLGKTIEAGIILKEYLLRGQIRTALVLTPASLCEQWAEELREKFELDFVVSRGAEGAWGAHPLVIASLETARHARHRGRVRRAGFDLVIVDEAHRLRNHLTLGWKFINELGARYLLLLTATPVQNDLRELYNLVTLLRPGAVGTFAQFRSEFMTAGDRLRPRNTDKLRSLLSSVMIRAQRAHTNLKFPRRNVKTITVDLSPPEASLYNDVSEFVIKTIESGNEDVARRWYFTLVVLQKEMGSSIAAARKTLEHLAGKAQTGLKTKALKALAERAAKIEETTKLRSLVKLLQSLDDKAIVFTQFRASQEEIAKALTEVGVSNEIFHGEQTWQEKEEALDRFRGPVQFLISTETGGEGRNLQFAHMVVNYDLPWNPMRVEQRIGRVHRLGQTSDVSIFNLVARDTIESYVMEILEKKIRLFELVVGEVEEILGHWEPEGSFEDEVFKIWVENKDERVRASKYAEFAARLAAARKRYQEEQELQKALLPEERS
ncbi:MAG: DEAD/DEAH box helicase [Candidatus Eiseniibacteriota bacterium]